jgi:hypothetical protein
LTQTDPDFEHIIISDDIAHGLYWANRQIKEQAHKLQGQFVYILDDDDYIANPNFIKDFKEYIGQYSAITSKILVVCRGILNDELFPKIWKENFDEGARGKIAAPNMIVSRALFDKCAYAWDQPRAGDFNFLMEAVKLLPHIFWWDYEVFWAESSCGLTEEQKKEYGFYE